MIVPSLSSANGTLVAVLASLTEVTIFECVGGVRIINRVKIDSEPASMSLGPFHLGILMNTSAWFYR